MERPANCPWSSAAIHFGEPSRPGLTDASAPLICIKLPFADCDIRWRSGSNGHGGRLDPE